MTMIACRRCGQSREPLASPPMPGEWGTTLMAETCQECWHAWQDEQTRIINHENLRPWVPADKQLLYRKLREFLNLTIDPPKTGF